MVIGDEIWVFQLKDELSYQWNLRSHWRKNRNFGCNNNANVVCKVLMSDLIEMTNKMQLCRAIYYSIVPWLLNMFRAILPLIIRSF